MSLKSEKKIVLSLDSTFEKSGESSKIRAYLLKEHARGAGKSVVAIMLARALIKRGPVYLIDADESNQRMGPMLGADTPNTLMNYLGGMKELSANKEKIQNIKLRELPDLFRGQSPECITLIAVGKIEEFVEGCACPFGTLSKLFMQRLILSPGEYVVVDAEAGVEHLGRGVEAGIDLVVSVVDPIMESVSLARFVSNEVTSIGKRHLILLNKTPQELKYRVRSLVEAEGLTVSGAANPDPVFFESCLRTSILESG